MRAARAGPERIGLRGVIIVAERERLSEQRDDRVKNARRELAGGEHSTGSIAKAAGLHHAKPFLRGPQALEVPFMVIGVGEWGAASFENDPASDWFLLVEEAVDPGEVIGSALDRAVGESEYLGLDESCEAIAAAELSASCAGHPSVRLPDNVRYWVDTHPHQPHDSEIDHAVQAVQRVREESELRDYWAGSLDQDRWLRAVEHLITRLERSGGGEPATLSP